MNSENFELNWSITMDYEPARSVGGSRRTSRPPWLAEKNFRTCGSFGKHYLWENCLIFVISENLIFRGIFVALLYTNSSKRYLGTI